MTVASVVKGIRLIKGVILDKTMHLTDKYAINSEMRLTSGFYDILKRRRISVGDNIIITGMYTQKKVVDG